MAGLAPPATIGARRLATLLGMSYAARVPVMAIPLVLILATRESGRDYAVAGLLTGVYTVGLAVTAPLIGRLADRHGAGFVFGIGAPTCAGMMVVIARSIDDAPQQLLLACAFVAGGAMPPLGALTRGLVAPLLDDRRRERVYAIDATAQELCFIGGPLLVGVLAPFVPATEIMILLAVLVVAGALGYAWIARGLHGRADDRETGDSPLASGGFRALLAMLMMVGVMFGASEIAITAALDDAGRRDRAGVAIAIWAVGSMLGGAAAVRWPATDPDARLRNALVGAAATSLALAAVTRSPLLLGAGLLLNGAVQAPLLSVSYNFVPRFTQGRLSEAFAWLTTVLVGGIALGTAVTGSAIHAFSAPAGFVLSALAAVLGLAVAVGLLSRAGPRPQTRTRSSHS